jgi:hypothetical protein
LYIEVNEQDINKAIFLATSTLVLKWETSRDSGTIDQETAASGSAVDGEPAVGGEDGAGVDLYAAWREGGHLEGNPLRRHEGQLHIHHR